MKQCRCIRDCWMEFGGRRHWQQDMIATVEDDVNVPEHFEVIGVSEKFVPPPVVDEMNTLSGIQAKQKELSSPKAGFAANLDKLEPEQKTRRKKTV